MIFEDYKKAVLKAYQQKKNAGQLSDNLAMPTPKKIKDECLMVLARRYDKKDEQVIRFFFDPLNNHNDLAKSIEKIEVDKFRPLISFVKGERNRTEDKNVKLLAWLIDFEPRPFKFFITEIPEIEEGNNDGKTSLPTPPSKQKPQIKFFVAFGLLIVFLACGGVFMMKYQSAKATYSGEEKCMYWAEDHYQPITCTQKVEGALVIALDTVRLMQFKKITKPDTITIKSVGKVYYFKHNGRLEFFTSGGFHPVYLDRKLKPLTAYMLANYASE